MKYTREVRQRAKRIKRIGVIRQMRERALKREEENKEKERIFQEQVAKSKGICPKCKGSKTISVYVVGLFEGSYDCEECSLCKGVGLLY